jgi:hypothetical protein
MPCLDAVRRTDVSEIGMVITAPRQSETIRQLLRLADGDRELVHEALKSGVDPRTGMADLEKVVAFIRERMHRRRAAA